MANYVGAVRFPDGVLLYFSFAGTVDMARRPLFLTPDSVDHNQDIAKRAVNATSGDPVEVMPYFCHESDEVMFMSTASRQTMQITGAVSMDEASRLSDQNAPWGI